jgi:putative tryptophan/tyrosine transport system substrate-binding protein
MRLVASLSHPGGNATGATFLSVELGKKRVELLRDLVPRIAVVALLVNPGNPTTTTQTKDMQTATNSLGLKFQAIDINAQTNLETVFATLVQQQVDGLVISADFHFHQLTRQLRTHDGSLLNTY